jgi:hypothetical protein
MIKTLLHSIPIEIQKIQVLKSLTPVGGSGIAIIKSQAPRHSVANPANLPSSLDTSKTLKVSISLYMMGCEGAYDFGKLTLDKFKTKKDPELESNFPC